MSLVNQYKLGGNVELRVSVTDQTGATVEPTLVRLSVRHPDGEIMTVSGGDLTEGDGYLSYLYRPTTSGYYSYEGWVIDAGDREGTDARGFYVSDRIVQ